MDINPKLRINYSPNPYYDINLFIDRIVPLEFKTIFPSKINIFMANMNTFQNYKELKDIDIVLCNTKQCYNFINFIKKKIVKNIIIHLKHIILNLQHLYQCNYLIVEKVVVEY